MKATKNEIIEAVKCDDIKRTEALLDEGCEADTIDEEGRPLLLLAIKSGSSRELIELLIDRGADLHWTTEEGVGLLDEAVERNRLDLAELFMERGIDPAVTRRGSGMTALMLAASFDYIDMMELLCEKGADLFAVDEQGLSASDYARKLGRIKAKRWLDEKIANPF